MLAIRKKIATLLITLMLVSFYGNLGLRAAGLVREKERDRRLIRWFFIGIRNVIASLFKFIWGVIGIVIGIVWTIVWAVLYELFCWSDFPADDCLSYNMVILGVGCFAEGVMEILDIERTIRSSKNIGDLKWSVLDRNKKLRLNRELTAEKDPKAQAKFDCNEYTEKTPGEVLAAVLKEDFDKNRQLHKYVSDAIHAELYLRQGYVKDPNSPLNHEERVKLDKEILTNLIETIKQKTLLFRSRIKRSTCAAVKSFNDKLDLEINPDRWTGNKKAKYEKLKAETKVGDKVKGAEAQKKISEMFDKFDPKKEESKKKIGEMLVKELTAYGVSKHDMSSQFTTNVIKAALLQYGKTKMADVQAHLPQAVKNKNKDVEGLQVGMKKVDETNLEDDSELVASEVNTMDEEQEDKKDKQQI